MEKKIYVIPTTQEYSFQAGSLLNVGSPVTLGVDNSEANGIDDENDTLSRRRSSLWDDED